MKHSHVAAVAAALSMAAATAAGTVAASPQTTDPPSTASDSDWAAVEEAGVDEGKVVFVSGIQEPQQESLETAFEAAYPGIDMEWQRLYSNDAEPVLEAEQSTNQQRVDVYVPERPSWLITQSEAGNAATPLGPAFDNPDFDRERWMLNDDLWIPSLQPFAWVWNTEVCPDSILENGITSWDDFLDPSLGDGFLIFPGDPNVASVTVSFWEMAEAQAGEGFLEKLGAQDPHLATGSAEALSALTSGESCASPLINVPPLVASINDGAPLDYAFPPEGFWTSFMTGMIFAAAPHPNAAQLLANYIISPEGQAALNTGGTAVLPGIERTVIEPDQGVLSYEPDPDALAAFIARWDAAFHG